MNSELSETVKRPLEPSEPENESVDESSPVKKFRGVVPNEHAKPKRRGRRGKKRKQRKSSGAPCRGEHSEDCSANTAECEEHCMSWNSDDEDLEEEDNHFFSNVLIRPTDVPKAPENSTQFIIDDHDECRLYMSFETPNPYLANYLRAAHEDNSEIIEPEGVDAAYVDIDYEYESPHDFDNSAYNDREFERSYKNNRFDELMRLSHDNLVTGLRTLEDHIKDLGDELVKEDPDPILDRLQTELLELQENHSLLEKEHSIYLGCLERWGVPNPFFDEQSGSQISAGEEHADKNLYADAIEEEDDKHSVDTSKQYLEKCDLKNLHLKESGEREIIVKTVQDKSEESFENLQNLSDMDTYEEQSDKGDREALYDFADSYNEPVLPYSDEPLVKPNSQSPLSEYNQKENSESPCHIPCTDASNKENACFEDITSEERLQTSKCTPRHESCNDSCSEHISVKDKGMLRGSEFNESQRCEEMPSAPEELELNAVIV